MEPEIRIRLAAPADAAAVQGLVRACYGATYPELRDGAEGLARRLASGQAAYALATGEDGEVVGQVALERRGPGLWEHGRAIVAPSHRCRGLLASLSRLLFEEFAPRHGVRFVYGRSVTNHLRTQRYNLAAGFSPLGLLLGVWEPGLRVAGVPEATQPISALLVGLWLDRDRRPRRLALAGRDLERAREVLGSFGVGVDEAPRRPRRSPLRALREEGQGGRLVHLRLTEDPSAPVLDGALGLSGHSGVAWADVPAESPGAAARLEALRARGFTWGAYLPHGGPQGEDVVRLQRYDDPRPLALEAIQVVEAARGLRDEVHAEALEAALAGAP